MIVSVLWTLVCMVGFAIWAGIAADSFYFWRRLGSEDPALGKAYFRELLGDTTIVAVLAFWTLIGAAALLAPNADGLVAIAIVIGLFSGPIGLTLLGIWRAWRRRRAR